MITVENEGVTQLLDILEDAVKLQRPPSKEKIDKLLSTKWISFMTEAYATLSEFSKEGLADVLTNITRVGPVAQGMVLTRLEEGFRSCLSVRRISAMRIKLQKMMVLDYTKSEFIALTYLPPETPITSTIYLSIDAVNPGMVFGGNVSLSLLDFDPENFDFKYLAHELHHLGFRYWIEKDHKLANLAFSDNIDHREIAVNMILNLLSEGMANYFCTPNHVCLHAEDDEGHNRKIKGYEESLTQMVLEIQSLLSDCVSKSLPVEKCRDRLMNMIFDKEGILPPVHFIGARIIEIFDKDPTIGRNDIINLCKNPHKFFTFYDRTHDRLGLPGFSRDVSEQVSYLLGSA